VLRCSSHGPSQGERVARVEAAGDVRARQEGQQGLVVAELPPAEGLTDVRVEVDGGHGERQDTETRSIMKMSAAPPGIGPWPSEP
jgi:hypothetical protein